MTYEDAKAMKAKLESVWAETSAALKPFPRLANGLTPDAVRLSPEYRSAKLANEKAFAELRAFNTYFMRVHKRAYMLERRNR
jgi:hypothetical protein